MVNLHIKDYLKKRLKFDCDLIIGAFCGAPFVIGYFS